jgi:hypothetical protein
MIHIFPVISGLLQSQRQLVKGRCADICFWPGSVEDLRVGDHLFDLDLVGGKSDGDKLVGLNRRECHFGVYVPT